MAMIPVTMRDTNKNEPEDFSNARTAREPRKPKRRPLKKLAAALIVLALLIGGTYAALRAFGIVGSGALIESGKYQALFLTNGQVYFGKLSTKGDNTYVLTNIFYLQTTTAADSQNPQKTDTSTADNVKLIKLGSEVHGPEDKMIVNRDQVLFFENLKKDGKVSSSIDQYAANK